MKYAVFLIKSNDRKGLLATISNFFYEKDFNILRCQQYTDLYENKYYMRVKLDIAELHITRRKLENAFKVLADSLGLEWQVHYSDYVPRVAVMVSHTSHCMYDLLVHQHEGDLQCEIPLVISNHSSLEHVADKFRVPFFCCPVSKSNKSEQEKKVIELLQKNHIDLVVLARYMQILSDDFIQSYTGRVINIHHAFLPAFKGADPYRRAWERGVKVIGATAHYATRDLDEGPIIEQDVEHISHEFEPADLKRIGKDIERRVLTRAVKAHLEHRVITSGLRTIVFPV
ncbi:formyltetrahydrofolate deformylase [Lentisphaerota bacterium ZTH]|nr:formyltetrahydrofolate deformylase [Lentisphaerota bacterium]WET05262.1 formyltetrahydrofolate deformylase [Lentisphaerota bacterium ZTH]